MSENKVFLLLCFYSHQLKNRYICQLGAYKMSAFDDCSDYKSNASSTD